LFRSPQGAGTPSRSPARIERCAGWAASIRAAHCSATCSGMSWSTEPPRALPVVQRALCARHLSPMAAGTAAASPQVHVVIAAVGRHVIPPAAVADRPRVPALPSEADQVARVPSERSGDFLELRALREGVPRSGGRTPEGGGPVSRPARHAGHPPGRHLPVVYRADPGDPELFGRVRLPPGLEPLDVYAADLTPPGLFRRVLLLTQARIPGGSDVQRFPLGVPRDVQRPSCLAIRVRAGREG